MSEQIWYCRRCMQKVRETDDGKRCGCTESPSPWEPLTNFMKDDETYMKWFNTNPCVKDCPECGEKEKMVKEDGLICITINHKPDCKLRL